MLFPATGPPGRRKGNPWYRGMKLRIGLDSKTKLLHSTLASAASVHDSQVLDDLLHWEETRVRGGSASMDQKGK